MLGSPMPGGPRACPMTGYFIELETFPYIAFTFVPSPATAVTIASATPPAIRLYSIAVAPRSSARKAVRNFDILVPLGFCPHRDVTLTGAAFGRAKGRG